MRKTLNFWKAFSTHPPALIRLYARRRRGKTVEAITAEEIALTSGIPLARIHEISAKVSWEGVTITEAERFCLAAGFDPTSSKDRNRERAYSRKCTTTRPRFQWLTRSPKFESEFRPLIAALKNCPPGSSPTSLAPESLTTS